MTTEIELPEIKSYLNITWDEQDTDRNINRFIKNGKEYLNSKAGVELVFKDDHLANQLLFDYCRYAYNHSLELFSVNFAQELFDLSLREGVKDHATTDSETSS